MKLFPIRGGVHPEGRKRLTADKAIEAAPLPEILHIPLQQHIGQPAEPCVARGDRVLKGQLIASPQGPISAPIHAPTSGEILGVSEYPAPHPSGLPARTMTLRPDGEDRWAELPPPLDDAAAPEAVAERVAWAGIVGMGGATFPAAVKLNLRQRCQLHTLVINGAECEPYLTCDDRLMRERAELVLDGIGAMRRALEVPRAVVAIEANKPEALAAMRAAAQAHPEVTVVRVPTRYPMGSEKHLVQTLTGLETPARALTADIGVVVHNVATAFAVHQAVRLGRPLISRVVTVSGGAIRRPRNLEVVIGTPISFLLDQCDGFARPPVTLIAGGPMMGQPLPSTEVPLVKGTNGILALTAAETPRDRAMPCIRCGTCVEVCPCGLVPLDMAARIRKEELQAAADLGLMDCLSCGSCAYACPSHIPLVQYFNYAKGRLREVERQQRKQEVTKRIAERRQKRLEAEKRAKQAMLAKRKAEAAAKAAAKAAAPPPDAANNGGASAAEGGGA